MKKISTLFRKDPNDLSRVINEINPENSWVLDVNSVAVAMRKYDGTACAIIKGELYKRYDVKKGKQVPQGAIPCQDPDEITGHWPHWVKCDRANPADKYHFEGFDNFPDLEDGTYELCGPKVQGNPDKFQHHVLIAHNQVPLPLFPRVVTWESVQAFLSEFDVEGVVFHHPDGRMCKIRKSDFGIKR